MIATTSRDEVKPSKTILKNLKGHMPNHARTLGTAIDHWVIAAGCTKPTAKLVVSPLGERRVGIDAIIAA